MLVKNIKYEIKTSNGWEDFSGIQKLEKRKTFYIVLENGLTLDCTENHKLKTPHGFIELSNLYEGDVIDTENGFKKIIQIKPNVDLEDVYDVTDTGKNNSYYTNEILSHNCEFIGSTNTLIHPTKLRSLVFHNPSRTDDGLDVLVEPKSGRTYTLTVDVAEGQGLDYSAFSVFDVTEFPYRQVAKYRSNQIAPLLLPTKILTAARLYNDAFVLVEINSIGLQVADILHYELAYENLIKIEMKGRQGQHHTPGFKKRIAFGLKTSTQTKMIGCTNLKALIENDKLLINDADTIMELTTFSADKKSFKAEEGNNDDLAMTLVHFGWLTGQRYFKENINSNIRQALQEEQLKLMDQDLVPFGIIDNGIDQPGEKDKDGDLWFEDRKARFPFDNFSWDWRSKL